MIAIKIYIDLFPTLSKIWKCISVNYKKQETTRKIIFYE